MNTENKPQNETTCKYHYNLTVYWNDGSYCEYDIATKSKDPADVMWLAQGALKVTKAVYATIYAPHLTQIIRYRNTSTNE